MGLALDKRTACSGWYIVNGFEGGRKGLGVFFSKSVHLLYSDVISIALCVHGVSKS